MVAGFENPTGGTITIGGRDVTRLKPQKRDVGMVFQNYALFPHLDVWDNVEFGLRSRGVGREAARPKVERALELVEMGGYGKRKVQELSGGQQQRVALARALAPEPPLLLLDEPLSNLDAALRERTRTELRAILKRLGMTAVFVTHDQEEAFALSDRIAVMERGHLQQLGTPETLYAAPANAFVASFLGRANFLPATVESVEGEMAICRLAAGPVWRARLSADAPRSPGSAVRVMVRPEALRITRSESPAPDALAGRVIDRRFAGPVSFYTIAAGDAELLAQSHRADAAPGDIVALHPAESEAAVAFPA
jgi:iron(III) transport system ATP-binding protein